MEDLLSIEGYVMAVSFARMAMMQHRFRTKTQHEIDDGVGVHARLLLSPLPTKDGELHGDTYESNSTALSASRVRSKVVPRVDME
jgi:hypothetical protein